MAALILIIAAVIAVAVDIPYSEMTKGKHWDCDAIRHQEVAFKTTDDALDALDYCLNDRMYDRCNVARYGQDVCTWKKGL